MSDPVNTAFSSCANLRHSGVPLGPASPLSSVARAYILSWVSLCGGSQGQSMLRDPRPVSGVILQPSVWGSVGPWLAPSLPSSLQTNLVSMILLLAQCWDSSLHLASVLNATDLLGFLSDRRKDPLQPRPSNSRILTKRGHTYTD